MHYALVENGVVTNLIWLYPGNAADFPSAVPLGDVPAGIGDTYEDGVFYRDGNRVLTFSEEIQKRNQDMAEALALLGVETEAKA